MRDVVTEARSQERAQTWMGRGRTGAAPLKGEGLSDGTKLAAGRPGERRRRWQSQLCIDAGRTDGAVALAT